ncbi:MAG: SDR family oxidoreductase, partial [Deltaproteobacteria bacterium]
MQKRILVTGGAGFIGSTLTRFLHEAGHAVAILDNFSFGRRALVPSGVEIHEADLRDRRGIARVIGEVGAEEVYHLAAIHFIPYCNAHPEEAAAVNIQGTRNLLEALREQRPKTLFFASTAAVYPISDVAHHENDPADPMDIYGITKLIGEDLVRLFHLDTGVRTIVGRFFNAYGPNETNDHVIPEIVAQLRAGKRTLDLGNIDPKRDFIHTRDLCRAVIGLVERFDGRFGILNIGTGEEISVREVVALA